MDQKVEDYIKRFNLSGFLVLPTTFQKSIQHRKYSRSTHFHINHEPIKCLRII
uniref:Uncharacterized protein n=1 Tax=Tetranychus urticae TaxID=32264 RepID=T1KSW2_TETUR